MISAWKKFLHKSDINHNGNGYTTSSNGTVPPGIQKLDKELQRKFARGVNYNMKVVIKGDARVGKTSLFLRLKGYNFDDNYNPTETLNVTSINWNYKATDDIVKIDLWEAIDSIASKKTLNYVDLKMENNIESQSTTPPPPSSTTNGHDLMNETNANFNNNTRITQNKMTITNTNLTMNGNNIHQSPIPESAKQSLALLSEHLDVYKGADAVLLVMDMTKSWTFKYIHNEVPKVPKHIPILIVANHKDQGHHRTVSPEQVKAFIDGIDRNSACDGIVMYTEASMKNGFGLKLIEKFFNIPFLKLQETSLLKQLELNRCDFMTTLEELQLMEESTNKEYEQYLELQTIKRRQQADAMSPVNSGLKQLDETTREQIRNTTMSSETMNSDNMKNVKSIDSTDFIKQNNNSVAQMVANEKFVNNRLPSIVIGAKCPLPETKTIQMNSQNKDHQEKTSIVVNNDKSANIVQQKHQEVGNEGTDDESDDEIPTANPLVAGYQSDLDSDDQITTDSTIQSKNKVNDIETNDKNDNNE